MERTGFQRELRDREVDVECRGFGPSFNMDNTHYHDCFEVYFQISGDRNLLSGGRFHHLEPGSVLWIPKFDLHQSFQGQQDTGTRAVLYFREEYLRGVLQERAGELLALFAGPFQVMRLDVFQRRKALELLYELEQGSRAGQELYARFVFGQLVLLLEAWSRAEGALPQEAAPTMGPKYDRIASVLAYLKNHREERLRLEDVARAFFVTPAYLSRSFKACTGLSFVTYLNHLKVERAKELLLREGSVTQVSLELGYESLTHFERVFRQIAGLSPTEWRKRQRPGEDKIS